MKNMLCYDTLALEHILDEQLFAILDEIQSIAIEIRDLPVDRVDYFNNDNILKERVNCLLNDSDVFTDVGAGVVHFKLFKDDFCDFILSRAKDSVYTPNEAEPLEAQIPEIILQEHFPFLFTYLCDFYFDIISDLQVIIYGISPVRLVTIQLAKYGVHNTKCGAWHSDNDSDLTMTVCLNDDFEGGGVQIKVLGETKVITVEKKPKGTATLFTGKMCLHRGFEVTKGDRDLLVFWSEIK